MRLLPRCTAIRKQLTSLKGWLSQDLGCRCGCGDGSARLSGFTVPADQVRNLETRTFMPAGADIKMLRGLSAERV